MSRIKKDAFTGFFWSFLERFGAQGVTFVVSILLARLLEPSTYGDIALITAFTAILEVFVNGGLGAALIQKKDADDIDFSSVFYVNIFTSIVLYSLLFLAAPHISHFYNRSMLTRYIRVMGISLIISSVKNVEHAYVTKNLLFKKFFFSTIGGTVGAGILGFLMAYKGFGIWALICQNLFNQLTDTIILWFTAKWRPKLVFSIKRVKRLFDYGWKMLASYLIDSIYNELRSLTIGKVYTSKDLAFYNRGSTFPNFIAKNVNSSIDAVLLPVLSKEQDNTETVKGITRKSMQVSVYCMVPLMAGLFICGKQIISLVLTDKWMPVLPFMRIIAITYVFWPLHTANLNAIKALGRSDYYLKLEIAKKIVGVIALAITLPISVMAMAYSLLITSVLAQVINSWPNKKLLNYSYFEQIKDIFPSILLAVLMGCCIYPIQWLGLPDIVTLCIQIPLGALIYIAGSKLFKLEPFNYLWGIAKNYLKKEKQYLTLTKLKN